MKSKKNFLALLLAIVLLITAVTVVSFTVFADEVNTDSSSTQTQAHNHTYEVIKAGSTTNIPTDTEHYKKCACGDIAKESHTWEKTGEHTGICTECGYTHNCDTQRHIYGNAQVYDSSAVDENGSQLLYTHHYKICEICGDVISSKHNWKAGWKGEEDEYHWIACQECSVAKDYGKHQDTDQNFINPDGEVESDGRCDICNHEMPNTHRYKLMETEEATCTDSGHKTYICVNCDIERYDEYIPKKGHSWSDDSAYVNYEWSDDGNTCTLTLSCEHGCGATLTYTVYRSGNTDNCTTTLDSKNPTCTESGYVKYKALFTIDDVNNISGWHCSASVFTNTLTIDRPAKGHVLEKDENNDPIVYEITKEATCAEDAVYTGRCANCGIDMPNQTLVGSKEKVDHKPGTPTSATETFNCQEGGTYDSITYCTECLKELNRETITVKPKDHEMVQFEDVVAATCFKDGTKTTGTRCSVCTYVESSTTQTLKSTGHEVKNYTSSIPATCTEAGRLIGVCGKCNSEVSIENANDPAKGHTLVGSPTGKGCHQECAVCGAVTRDSKNHVDLDFNLTCDNCNSKIEFLPNAIHYLGAWPMYWLRLLIHAITRTPII